MGCKYVNHQSLKKFYCSTPLHFNSFKPKAAYPDRYPCEEKNFFQNLTAHRFAASLSGRVYSTFFKISNTSLQQIF